MPAKGERPCDRSQIACDDTGLDPAVGQEELHQVGVLLVGS
jgi:hypothetical protein